MDWISCIIGAVVTAVGMFAVLYFAVLKAYEMGWNDAIEGEGIGDDV